MKPAPKSFGIHRCEVLTGYSSEVDELSNNSTEHRGE